MIYRFGSHSLEELRKLLPTEIPADGLTISCHSDADGIASGVFSSYKYKIKKVNFPSIFGYVGDEQIMFDMSPPTDNRPLLIIDHHPPKLNYSVSTEILGETEDPASYLSWSLFKDSIPEKHWWKLMVGLAGDGHPEKLPNEVWDCSKGLLDDYGSFVHSKGNDYLFTYPVWNQITSSVNSLCRAGWSEKAFNLLKEAETPYDILEDSIAKEYKDKIMIETIKIFKETKPIDLGSVLLWKINSMYRITGILATRLYETRKKTAVVINTSNNAISIRGVLAKYLQEKLAAIIESGGHYGFVGGVLLPSSTLEQLKEALRRI